MTGIGWNFGDNVSAAPPSSSIVGSGWSSNYASSPLQSSNPLQQPPSRPMGIGFVFDEPRAPMTPQAPPVNQNPHHLGVADNLAKRSQSMNVPQRPPPSRQRNPNPYSSSFEVVTPGGDTANVPGKALSAMNSRPSSRSDAYERGLNDMAELMTTVDIDEAEKRRIRERFALD
ncbi:unnamed protein product [Rodentolepis nana]|uniref:Similar to n=1 Tax=Rodentolepis nana TaxID=102285 RepID=A0A0R3TRU5_RODNA|nr:unnamed protein product [Rodentolepis nana]